MPDPRFGPAVGAAELRREKARAREMRQSTWWKRRLAEGICHYCRRRVGHRALTADHVVPLIRGGRSSRGNMVPACKDCNNRKQSLLPWEWEDYLKAQGPGSAESE
jgi:5-methylcytosine-specific restriction endonuclease McrA